ncbi:hypothetical protein [Archaeoglobus neptunius]|uniref:hypothetical protein n=1 Tax=Archaeoglobus neptunius TaxID=2798580 RepID=UPI0019265461|nr:hypothetical protein [Archaeoglobus neptunius]
MAGDKPIEIYVNEVKVAEIVMIGPIPDGQNLLQTGNRKGMCSSDVGKIVKSDLN